MDVRRFLTAVLALTALISGSFVGAASGQAVSHPVGRLSRSSGPLIPTRITINGRALATVTAVRFGASVVHSVSHHASTGLAVTTPRRTTPGAVTVALLSKRRWTAIGVYRYLARPVITGLSSTSGQPSGGGTVVLTGRALTPAPIVRFGTTRAAVRQAGPGRLVVTVPPALDGAVGVSVSTAGGASRRATYRYITPADHESHSYTPAPDTVTIDPDSVQWVTGGPDVDDLDDTAYAPWLVSLAAGVASPPDGADVFLEPGHDVFPSGLTGVVASTAAQQDGSTRVTINPAPLDSSLSSARVSFSGDSAAPQESSQVRRLDTSGEVDQDFAGEASYDKLGPGAFTCENNIGDEVSFSGSLSLEFTKLRPVANFDATTGPSFNVYLQGSVDVTGKVTAEESASCRLRVLWADAHRRIIPIGTSGATVSFGPAVEFKLSVAGTVEVKQTTRFMYGVSKYMNDAPQLIHVAVNSSPDWEVNSEVSIGVSAGVSVQFGLLDRIGIQAKAELYATATASAPVVGKPHLCVSVDWGFSISLDAYLDLFVARWDSAARTYRLNFEPYHHCGDSIAGILDSSDPVIADNELSDATIGQEYDAQLSTADGRDGTWQATDALPGGLALSDDGELSGTPTSGVGTHRIGVVFVDESGRKATDVLMLTVDPSDGLGGGDIQATLTWTGPADLDLHAEEPDGNEIYFENPGPSDGGGELDHDSNADCAFEDDAPAENIHWPAGDAESGTYYVWVQTYAQCDTDDLNWHLVVRVKGQVVLDTTGYDTSDQYEIDYDSTSDAIRAHVQARPLRPIATRRIVVK